MTAPALDALLKIAEQAAPQPIKPGTIVHSQVAIEHERAAAAKLFTYTFNPTVAQALVRGMQVVEELANGTANRRAAVDAMSALTAALKGIPHG